MGDLDGDLRLLSDEDEYGDVLSVPMVPEAVASSFFSRTFACILCSASSSFFQVGFIKSAVRSLFAFSSSAEQAAEEDAEEG